MKYTSLKSDIINILHSSDYNLNLRFYDENGKTTLDSDDVNWIYINNNNIMIEFMNDNDSTIYIWKSKSSVDNNMKNIVQRIREIAVLNGISVQIRVYENLDQRKIYNLIKSSISSRKDDKNMNESFNKIVNTFQNIISTAKNTKKPSDFYMSESILSQNYEKILTEMFNEVKSLKALNKLNLSEMFNKLMIVKSKDDIINILSKENKNTLNKLYESIDNISNIPVFVRQKYLNNIPSSQTKNTLYIFENIKVYNDDVVSHKDNLINAYNALLTVSENSKSKIDLLKEIKNHKILETYNISKNELLDFWLEKDGKYIPNKKSFIIENYLGEKFIFDADLNFGIKALALYLNNGGSKDSKICQNIIEETIKYNEISDFINKYKNSYQIRKIIPQFKNIFNETVKKLSTNDFNQSLFESVEDSSLDYSKEYNKLCKKLGIKHNALKYLAIEEAKKIKEYSMLLNEEKNNDMEILTNFMKNYTSYPSIVADNIINNKLDVKLTESIDNNLSIASNIYNQISFRPEKYYTGLSSALFSIINSNKKDKNVDSFISTLIKYC